jgi:hypothetical protein
MKERKFKLILVLFSFLSFQALFFGQDFSGEEPGSGAIFPGCNKHSSVACTVHFQYLLAQTAARESRSTNHGPSLQPNAPVVDECPDVFLDGLSTGQCKLSTCTGRPLWLLNRALLL